jgi:N6-adenosine-specific RNA methylase IME4/ParB-like chromosome segregation protein Spo0J
MTDTKQRCGAIHPKQKRETCARDIGHVGMHSNGGNVIWKGPGAPKPEQPQPERCGVRWERSADGARLTKEKQLSCEREKGHDLPHRANALEGNHVSEWEGDGSLGGRHIPRSTAAAIKTHPAADALPLIEGPEFEALVEDIRVNGQRHKIIVDHTGEWLVDGRNRKRACEQLGIEPAYERLPEGTNIEAYVISTNLKRRHLTESQRAIIAAEIANLPQGHKKTRPDGGSGQGVTQAEAAGRAGVGERTVQRANAVRDKGVPELVDAVKKGKVDHTGAEQVAKLSPKKQREILKERVDPSKGLVRGGKLAALARQEDKRAVVRKINADQVAPSPVGPFRLIVADFPWPYDNSDQHEGSRGHIPYPSMSIEQGIAMVTELERLAHEDGCILGFWTTNAFMPDAVRMVEAWGFSWRSIFTWDKERDGIGTWGRGRTEHLIIAERGEVEAHTLNEVSTLLRAKRREHSRKPDEAMEMFEKHCPGPRLEMFSREPREGWAAWGAEVQKFATEAA